MSHERWLLGHLPVVEAVLHVLVVPGLIMATATSPVVAIVAVVAVVPVGMMQMVVGRERHPGPVPGSRSPRVRPPRRTGMAWIHVLSFFSFVHRISFFAASANLCPRSGLKFPSVNTAALNRFSLCFSRQTTLAAKVPTISK